MKSLLIRKKNITLSLFSAFFALILFEILSYTIIKHTSVLDKYFFHKHKLLDEEDFNDYISDRNQITGWPTKTFEATLSDNLSRISPANEKYLKNNCYAVYGDSYAYDTEVNDKQAWPNQLAEIMSCGVLNFGIPGYGIDQAYLRFKNLNPKNLNAIMTFVEMDYRRARTQMYSLQSGKGINIELTKPMFEIYENNEIYLYDLPINSFDQYKKLDDIHYFNKFFSKDLFLPDKDLWSMSTYSFPYSFEIISLFIKLFKRQLSYGAYVKYHPTYQFFEYLSMNEFLKRISVPIPSIRDQTIALNEKILENFINDCDKLNINCYIAPLPLIMDFGKDKDSKIINSLKTNPILSTKTITIDNNCLIKEYKELGIYEEDISLQLAVGRHYNKITSKIVARCLFKELEDIS